LVKDNNNIHTDENEQKDENNNNSNNSKHGKCVPLAVYQKVFDDKQKLIYQLDEINKQLQSSINIEKINLISKLQNEIKDKEREKKTLENIVIKQEKSILNLQSKINKYENQLSLKNEQLLIKENIINELKEKIRELIEKNKNMKNNYKINENKEIIKMNDIINNLKNELEIKEKKMELNDIKFNNLQIKYLKLFQQKRKIENESLLKISQENLANFRSKNNFSSQIKFTKVNNTLNNNIKNNDINFEMNLPAINDANSSLPIHKDNNHSNKYIKKKKNLDIKETYSSTNNNE
jgi:hypothetical protein